MVEGGTTPCVSSVAGPYVERQGLAEYLRLGDVPLESNSPLGNATTVFDPAGGRGSGGRARRRSSTAPPTSPWPGSQRASGRAPPPPSSCAARPTGATSSTRR